MRAQTFGDSHLRKDIQQQIACSSYCLFFVRIFISAISCPHGFKRGSPYEIDIIVGLTAA